MSKLAIVGMLGTSAMIALQIEPAVDPNVALLRDELMKTLPMIANAKSQIEGIVGKAVGPETVLLALFIVFCGRGVMAIVDKIIDDWREERRERRARDREEWEMGIPAAKRSYPPRIVSSKKSDAA